MAACPGAGAADQELPRDRPGSTRRVRAARPLLWRLHFVSGFLIAPVVASLALTGILFAWNPQIEQMLYGRALTAVSDASERPLAQQVKAAAATHPSYEVTAVTPAAPAAAEGEATTAVTMAPPNPGTDRFGQDDGETTVVPMLPAGRKRDPARATPRDGDIAASGLIPGTSRSSRVHVHRRATAC